MDALQILVVMFIMALLRYLPVIALPAMSPFSWAPGMVRGVLLLGLSWLTVMSVPSMQAPLHWREPIGLIVAGAGELLLGMVFGLAIMVPNASLSVAGWLADTQAGLSAAVVFNPAAQHDAESVLGVALMLLSTVLFFLLDLHIRLFQLLVGAAQAIPLGSLSLHLDMDAFLAMFGGSFLLGLMVVSPIVLGLLMLDIAVGYATRSMPQANVYFLALPLKVAVALLLLAVSLSFAPHLIGRLFGDAFNRIPAVLGG